MKVKKILYLTAGIAIVVISLFVIWAIQSSSKDYPPQVHIQKAEEALTTDDTVLAFRHFQQAAFKDKSNPTYQWEAARLADQLGLRQDAEDLAQQAWAIGKKDIETLLLLTRNSSKPDKLRIPYALELIEELPNNKEKALCNAQLFLANEELEKALDILKPLHQDDPADAQVIYNIATIFIKLQRQRDGVELLENSNKKGYLNSEGTKLLFKIYSHIGNYRMALELIKSAKSRHYYDAMLQLEHGMMLYYMMRFDEAESVLASLKYPDRVSPNAVKGIKKLSKLLTENTPSKINELLSKETKKSIAKDQDLSIKSLTHFVIDLNDYITKDLSNFKAPNDEVVKRRNELQQLLKGVLESPQPNRAAHLARIFLAHIAFAKKERAKIAELDDLAKGQRRWLEGERAFISYIKKRVSHKNEEALISLDTAINLLDNTPPVAIQRAREYAVQGEFSKSVALLDTISKTLPNIAQTPLILTESARSLAGDHKSQTALTKIKILHGRGFYSKESLRLFRNLSASTNDLKGMTSAQKILEETFVSDPKIQTESALLALREGNIARATKIIEQVETKFGKNQHVFQGKLALLIAKKDYEGILASTQNPLDARMKALRASALAALNRPDEASNMWEQAYIDPNSAEDIGVKYGYFLLKQKNTDAALKVFSAIQNKNKQNSLALHGLSLCYLANQNRDLAYEYALKVVDLNPELPGACLMLARLAMDRGNIKEALSNAQFALSLNKEDDEARIILATVLNATGKAAQAKSNLDKVLTKKPHHPIALFELSTSLTILKKYSEAMEILDDLSQQLKNTLPFVNRYVQTALLAGLTDQAHTFIKETTSLEAPDKNFFYALISHAKGDYKKASSIVSQHLEQPRNIILWIESGILADETDNIFKKIPSLSIPEQSLVRLATLASKNKQHRLVRTLYQRSVELYPKSPIPLNNYAWTLADQDAPRASDLLAAEKHIQTANSILPKNAAIIDTYAFVLQKANKIKECITLLEDHPLLVASRRSLCYRLGMAHEKNSSIDKAIEQYQLCLLMKDTSTLPVSRKALQAHIKSLQSL